MTPTDPLAAIEALIQSAGIALRTNKTAWPVEPLWVCTLCGIKLGLDHRPSCPILQASAALVELRIRQRTCRQCGGGVDLATDRCAECDANNFELIADSEALSALRRDVQALVEALDAAKPALDALAMIGHVHSMPYRGPTYGEQLEAVRARLTV